LKTVVLLNIFVETMILVHFSELFDEQKEKKNLLYLYLSLLTLLINLMCTCQKI